MNCLCYSVLFYSLLLSNEQDLLLGSLFSFCYSFSSSSTWRIEISAASHHQNIYENQTSVHQNQTSVLIIDQSRTASIDFFSPFLLSFIDDGQKHIEQSIDRLIYSRRVRYIERYPIYSYSTRKSKLERMNNVALISVLFLGNFFIQFLLLAH